MFVSKQLPPAADTEQHFIWRHVSVSPNIRQIISHVPLFFREIDA